MFNCFFLKQPKSNKAQSDIGSIVAKALRVVFKVSDEHSRGVGELDLWEKLRDEIRKDEEVEGVFWELCELVAQRDLTGENLDLVFKGLLSFLLCMCLEL